MIAKTARALVAMVLITLTGWTLADTRTVIVELQGDPAAIYHAKQAQLGQPVSANGLAAYRTQLKTTQDATLAQIAASGIAFERFTSAVPNLTGGIAATIEHRYTLVLNGIALNVDSADVPALEALSAVKRVHPARMLNPQLDRSVAYTRATELYGAVHELSQFDDIREGYEGQGMIIAVIDTGIEWQHEMFGGDPTPPRFALAPASALIPTNGKIIYNMPYSDLAVEDGFGHGTHVASTAAGYRGFTAGADGIPLNADDVPVHGVAPQAKLMAYGVCSDVVSTPGSLTGVGPGGCLNVFTISALEDAMSPRTLTGFAKPVAHVINLSLGGEFGTADDATAVAASNAAALGAVVVAAAGNSGDTPGIIGSPSTGRRVISVANFTDPGSGAEWYVDVLTADSFGPGTLGAQVPANQYQIDDNFPSGVKVYPMAGTPAPPADSLGQYYVYVADGLTAADYPPEVSGRIALIDVGGASGAFAETANNAALAGAEAVLLIGSTENATAVTAPIPAAVIFAADAQVLLDAIGPNPANGAVSPQPIRLNPQPAVFVTSPNGSTSRGPVAGFGQIKPDIAAPGTNILAAVPPASVIGLLTATEHGVNYGAISGTSMASPHVAGIAALVKQANPGWNPDQIRTALINAATPMRDSNNAAGSYGSHNPNIHTQGGGYVDAHDAAVAKAMMGVPGDGIVNPSILGSHSFGSVPAIDSRCVHDEVVDIRIVDLRGTGGTYTLAAYNNRNVDRDGLSFFLSQDTVVVPANGSATFQAGLTIDGSKITDDVLIEAQWFVVATRTDGSEALSMPMFLRAVRSVPVGGGETTSTTVTYTGSVGPGSADAGVGEHVDVEVLVSAGTTRLQGDLTADLPTAPAYPDFDLELYDPTGTQIDSSGNLGSVESVAVDVSSPGIYVFRVVNYLNVQTDFTLAVTTESGGGAGPATVHPIQTEYTDGSGQAIDFDGAFTALWSGQGGEQAYEIEVSTGGGPWSTLDVVSSDTTRHDFELPDGTYGIRIRSHFPGEVCTFVELPSNEVTVVVDRREEVVVASSATAITSAAVDGSVWTYGVNLSNTSAVEYLNPVTLEIVAINSSSGAIAVINADNGGSGNAGSVAAFDFTRLHGDEALLSGETSASRPVQFSNPSGQLFTIETRVRAFRRVAE